MIYTVSYVVTDSSHPGMMQNQDYPPEVGQRIRLGEREYEIIEVQELLPTRGDFAYLHATCRPITSEEEG